MTKTIFFALLSCLTLSSMNASERNIFSTTIKQFPHTFIIKRDVIYNKIHDVTITNDTTHQTCIHWFKTRSDNTSIGNAFSGDIDLKLISKLKEFEKQQGMQI